MRRDGLKFVVFSDLHAHPHKDKNTILKSGRSSRLQDCLDVLDQIQAEECDGFLFGGDLFHERRRIDVDTFNQVLTRLYENPAWKLYLKGNHDDYTKTGEIHSLQVIQALASVNVVDTPSSVVYRQPHTKTPLVVWVWAIPYSDDAGWVIEKVEEGISKAPDDGAFKILLLHQGLDSAQISASDTVRLRTTLTRGNLETSEWDLILSGHYHIPQKLGNNIYHIGAPMHHGWRDANEERGYWILTVNPDHTWSMDLQQTEAPKFVAVDSGDEVRANKRDFIRVLVEGEGEADLTLYEDAGIDVEVHRKAVPKEVKRRMDIDVSMSLKKILSRYVDRESPDSLDRDRLMQSGLALLGDLEES